MAKDTDYSLPEVLDTYRKDGSLIREKARVLAEQWLDQIYPRLVDPEIPTPQLLDIGKELFKLGDLLPKTNAPTGPSGPAFSISINIGEDATKTVTVTSVSEDTDLVPASYQVIDTPIEEVAPEELPPAEDQEVQAPSAPITIRGFDI